MINLWNSDNCAKWQEALEEYPEVIRAQRVRGLAELDAWYRGDFPELVASRQPACVTPNELERVTTWKMKRGVWRERNRLLVAGNSPAVVQKITREALAAVPDLRTPISILSRLAGVGPATASALLAGYAPALFPFFDELVAQQIPGLGTVAFTATYYYRYAAALRERAAKLNEHCKDQLWTADMMGQALWAGSGGKIAQARTETP